MLGRHDDETTMRGSLRKREADHGLIRCGFTVWRVMHFETKRFSGRHQFRRVVVTEVQRLCARRIDSLHCGECAGSAWKPVEIGSAEVRRRRRIVNYRDVPLISDPSGIRTTLGGDGGIESRVCRMTWCTTDGAFAQGRAAS
jgi:hypothetical protein